MKPKDLRYRLGTIRFAIKAAGNHKGGGGEEEK